MKSEYLPISDIELWMKYCETGKTDKNLLKEINSRELQNIPIVRWNRNKRPFGSGREENEKRETGKSLF